MRPVVVLRPEPGASATVAKARELGLHAIAIPLFEVEPVEWQVPDPARFDALLLTSANALRHGGEQLRALRHLQVYAVGEATARVAREAGFDVASVGEGGVDRLLGAIEGDLKLIHLCGEDRTIPADSGHTVTPITVYRSRELANPGRIASDCIVLIHSPRAGRRLADLVEDRSWIAIVAISPEAARAAGGGWQSAQAADVPTDDALLALAASLCNKRTAG